MVLKEHTGEIFPWVIEVSGEEPAGRFVEKEHALKAMRAMRDGKENICPQP